MSIQNCPVQFAPLQRISSFWRTIVYGSMKKQVPAQTEAEPGINLSDFFAGLCVQFSKKRGVPTHLHRETVWIEDSAAKFPAIKTLQRIEFGKVNEIRALATESGSFVFRRDTRLHRFCGKPTRVEASLRSYSRHHPGGKIHLGLVWNSHHSTMTAARISSPTVCRRTVSGAAPRAAPARRPAHDAA